MRSSHAVSQLSHFIESGPIRYAAQQIRHSFATDSRERWFEWLLRPQLDGISTSDFVSAVQSLRLAVDLDQRVVRDAVAWLDRQPINTRLTINVSSDSISNRFFTTYVSALLNRSTLMPEQICFDLLGSETVGDLSSTARFIRGMRDLGCSIALDSSSSRNPIMNLFGPMGHIDYLKINRDWVRQAVLSVAHRKTLESAADFGRRLGIDQIAVGVDSNQHLHLIRDFGIDYYQGYVNGEPELVSQWGIHYQPQRRGRSA